jgi:hypothetical protein
MKVMNKERNKGERREGGKDTKGINNRKRGSKGLR